MFPMPPKARSVTRRVFVGALIALGLEAGIIGATWPLLKWRYVLVAVATVTSFTVATMGLFLAGDRWPALGKLIQMHPTFTFASVLAIMVSLFTYILFPDPLALILGPVLLGLLVLIGWGIQRGRGLLGV